MNIMKTMMAVVVMLTVGLGGFGVASQIKETKLDSAVENERQMAKKIALAEAQIAETEAYGVKVEVDYEHGKKVYDVEYHSNGYEYDCTIDAETQEVIHSRKEVDEQQAPATTDIGREEAIRIALAHAGSSSEQAKRIEAECDYDDGRLEYDVEFVSGQNKYEYEIDGVSGSILKHEVEKDD